MKKARITEIYSSIQGEGLYLGEKQLFVRFYGCNLGCKFCDEKKKRNASLYTREDFIAKVLKHKNEETIALTGGEPLLYADFLKGALPALKREHKRIYLETNGVLKKELLKILDFVDIISMDFKLPSSTGLRPYWKEHSDFLKKAIQSVVFVKSIITRKTTLSDVEKAASLIESIDKRIPFILQPANFNGRIEEIDLLSAFFDSAKSRVPATRVLPQIHKILGVR